MSRLVLLALLSVGLFACSKEEPKKAEESASEEKKKDDSEDEGKTKKKKAKKTDDEDKPKEDDKPKDEPTEGSRDGKASLVPEGTPIPPGCAPDPSGLVGAKPKLVTSAGQPGASLAIWQPADGDKKRVAVTISADGKCYVDYLEMKAGPGNVAELLGYSFEKGAIQAVTGVTEKSGSTIVGFKVTYTEGAAMKHRILDTYSRFYGYVHANGTPYSCGKIAGEKGDRCTMYHKPLLVQTSSMCKDEKGGGPPVLAAPSVAPLKLPPGIKLPVPTPSTSVSAIPSTVPSAAPSAGDAGVADAGSECTGTPTCSTTASMYKDAEHIYVRASAGKPVACSTSTVKIGDTWYFDENTWKKR